MAFTPCLFSFFHLFCHGQTLGPTCCIHKGSFLKTVEFGLNSNMMVTGPSG